MLKNATRACVSVYQYSKLCFILSLYCRESEFINQRLAVCCPYRWISQDTMMEKMMMTVVMMEIMMEAMMMRVVIMMIMLSMFMNLPEYDKKKKNIFRRFV